MPGSLHIHRRPPTAGALPEQGCRIVLVHGTMDRSTSFTRLMARLPEWDVITYDRRGYGRSAAAGIAGSFEHQAEDLLEVLDGEPAIAFGHSLGGDVVLVVAERRPELIPAAVVWEPPQPWLDWWPTDSASRGAGENLDPEDRAEWFMRRMIGDRVWDRLPSATKKRRRAEGHALAADIDSLVVGPPFNPDRIRVPVIVGRGEDARPHHRRGTRELAATLPRGELAEIAGASHGAHLSHPGEIADLIRRARVNSR